MRFLNKLILFACVLGLVSTQVFAGTDATSFQSGPLPIEVEGVRINQLLVPLLLGVAPGEDHTMYLTRLTANRTQDRLMRISEPGVVAQYLESKGVPFILDKDGQLLGLDPRPGHVNFPNSLNEIKTNLWECKYRIFGAFAAALVSAEMYTSVVTQRPSSTFSPTWFAVEAATVVAIACGIFRFVWANQAPSANGANYFVKKIATNVVRIKKIDDGDFEIETKVKQGKFKRAVSQYRNLSDLIALDDHSQRTCGDALITMYARSLPSK